jgi:hypothetical protein
MPYSKEIFNQLAQPSGRIGKRILSHLNQVNVAINRVMLEHLDVSDGDKILGPYLLVFYRWRNRMGIPMPDLHPAWTGHAKRMLERDAVQSEFVCEKISVWE